MKRNLENIVAVCFDQWDEEKRGKGNISFPKGRESLE